MELSEERKQQITEEERQHIAEQWYSAQERVSLTKKLAPLLRQPHTNTRLNTAVNASTIYGLNR